MAVAHSNDTFDGQLFYLGSADHLYATSDGQLFYLGSADHLSFTRCSSSTIIASPHSHR